MSASARVFRTKIGLCAIESDRIVLSSQGWRGAIASALFGSSIWRVRAVYALIVVAFAASAVRQYVAGSHLVGAILCLPCVFFVFGIVSSRGLSGRLVIPRDEIRDVEVHAPRPGLTRGYFAVHFETNGKKLRRLIMLPGTLDDGTDEFVKAKLLLEEAHLLPSAS